MCLPVETHSNASPATVGLGNTTRRFDLQTTIIWNFPPEADAVKDYLISFARKVSTGCQTSSAYVVLETTTEYSLAAGENVGKISLSARMRVRLRVFNF